MNSQYVPFEDTEHSIDRLSIPSHLYLDILERRLARTREFLSEVITLTRRWDSQNERGAESPIEEMAELRPLLVVDKDQLQREINGLLLQISLITR